MKTLSLKELCEEFGIEKYSSVIATVKRPTRNGTCAIIDNTDGLEIFYSGITQTIGAKVLLTVSRIDEDAHKIFARFDSDFGFAA